MSERITIATAGNTLAPALAVVRGMGYQVTREAGGDMLYVAEIGVCILKAEDPLTLLGLAKLYEVRGRNWRPTDAEVSAFLALEGEE
jgi:hypothetical protein